MNKKNLNFFFLALAILLLSPAVFAGTVTRTFGSATATQGGTLSVTLAVDATEGTDAYYVIDEIYPSGWTVASAGGMITQTSGHLKLVVLSNVADTTYTYTLNVPSTATNGLFSGTYGFKSGQTNTILGLTTITVTSAPPSCTSVCTSGATQCSGTQVQTCADYNSDGCTEWSTAVDCPSGQSCNIATNTCEIPVLSAPSCADINAECSSGGCCNPGQGECVKVSSNGKMECKEVQGLGNKIERIIRGESYAVAGVTTDTRDWSVLKKLATIAGLLRGIFS